MTKCITAIAALLILGNAHATAYDYSGKPEDVVVKFSVASASVVSATFTAATGLESSDFVESVPTKIGSLKVHVSATTQVVGVLENPSAPGTDNEIVSDSGGGTLILTVDKDAYDYMSEADGGTAAHYQLYTTAQGGMDTMTELLATKKPGTSEIYGDYETHINVVVVHR